jgi:XTP/dITP diphosphohydrolase
MTRLVLSSRNKGKLVELQRMLATIAPHIKPVSVSDFPEISDVEETGATFEENALLKAETIAMKTGLAAIADDSGLCIDALNGAPGVLSARWSGEHGNDRANLEKVLKEIEDVQPDKRQGKFVSVVALALPDGRTEICRGEIHGVIRYSPVGDGGFGYDPIFQPDGYDVTMAQLSADEKDSISHRGRAMREIAPVIAQLLSE